MEVIIEKPLPIDDLIEDVKKYTELRMAPEEIVQYCNSTKTRIKLCNNPKFWYNYMIGRSEKEINYLLKITARYDQYIVPVVYYSALKFITPETTTLSTMLFFAIMRKDEKMEAIFEEALNAAMRKSYGSSSPHVYEITEKEKKNIVKNVNQLIKRINSSTYSENDDTEKIFEEFFDRSDVNRTTRLDYHIVIPAILDRIDDHVYDKLSLIPTNNESIRIAKFINEVIISLIRNEDYVTLLSFIGMLNDRDHMIEYYLQQLASELPVEKYEDVEKVLGYSIKEYIITIHDLEHFKYVIRNITGDRVVYIVSHIYDFYRSIRPDQYVKEINKLDKKEYMKLIEILIQLSRRSQVSIWLKEVLSLLGNDK